MALPVINIGSKLDGKGFKQAETAAEKLGNSVKNLGKAFGITFGAAALASYAKNSVKAFAENEKSAKRLATVVKNLGLAFEVPQIERNLEDISSKYGYQGEVLREAFQKLIGVTASAAKSTELLNLSLSISAGSTEDLLTVNQDLANAYVGNNKGLAKYNLGLTKSELLTLKFEDAVSLLTTKFKGSAQAELDTFGAKMRVLGEAAGNAQEIIGGGLIDSLMILSGNTSVEDLSDDMARLAVNTAEALKEMSSWGRGVFNVFDYGAGVLERFINATQPFADLLFAGDPTGFMNKPKPRAGRFFAGGQDSIEEAKLSKLRAAATAKELANQKRIEDARRKAALAEKNKISLSKAAAVFDSTRISLAAALSSTYDKETKLRLEALMLIEQDKGDEAIKKIGELAALQKNADLQRLAGVETISSATLSSLNTQLLTELKVINTSRMAEGDKELAREEAFKKYNAAITAAGTLAAKESYNERVQIQLTEIARLASLSKTTSAANTAALLLESAELSMIDRVAKAQAEADNKRLLALKDYLALLNGVNNNPFANIPIGGEGDYIPLGTGLGMVGRGAINTNITSMPELINSPTNNGYIPTTNQNIDLTINTGVGDPEAIARAVEDILNQSTYRGTSVNRGAGNYVLTP
jgi:hypothetical protein